MKQMSFYENATSENNSENKKSMLISDITNGKIIKNDSLEEQELENWDPKKIVFQSATNFYGFNEENGEAILYGHGKFIDIESY